MAQQQQSSLPMSDSAKIAMSSYLDQLRRKQALSTGVNLNNTVVPGAAMASLTIQQPTHYTPGGAPQFSTQAALQLPQSGKAELPTGPVSAVDMQLDSFMQQRRQQDEQIKQLQLTKRQEKTSRLVSVYPEPPPSSQNGTGDTFVKEGFWSNSPASLSRFPYPSAGDRPWQQRDIFLPCLRYVESVLIQSPSSILESSKAVEQCVLCEQKLGRQLEFVDASNAITWRASYGHYIETHNIQPSQFFYNYIVAATNALRQQQPAQQQKY